MFAACNYKFLSSLITLYMTFLIKIAKNVIIIMTFEQLHVLTRELSYASQKSIEYVEGMKYTVHDLDHSSHIIPF